MISKHSEDGHVKILAVGDIMLGISSLRAIADKNIIPDHINLNPNLISKEVSDLMSNKDILFGNLECTISKKFESSTYSDPIFLMAPPKATFFLKKYKFDILNLANNHTFDYGTEVFNETINLLENENIKLIGISKSNKSAFEMFRIKNLTIGFLGYNLCKEGKKSYVEDIWNDISFWKKSVDFLILSLHWGWGMEHNPVPSKDQIDLGHKLIDNGVDVILGHHSHVFQKIEVYRNKIIAYSLGNFIFDMKEDENVRSGILEISIDHNKNLKANIIPTIQKNYKISIDLTRVGGMDRMLTSNIYYSNDAQKRNHFSLRKKHNLDILFFYLLHLHKFSLVFHLKTISRWSKKVLARL